MRENSECVDFLQKNTGTRIECLCKLALKYIKRIFVYRFLPAAWCNLHFNFEIIHPKDKPMKLQRSWLKASKAVDKGMFSSYRQVSNRFDVQGSHINILNKVTANLQFENIMSCTCLCYPLHFSVIVETKTSHLNNQNIGSWTQKTHCSSKRLVGRNKNPAESIWNGRFKKYP